MFSLLPTFFVRHRAAFRNVIAFPAAQGPAAIVPAGGRPSVVDSTDPLPDSDVIRLLHCEDAGRGHRQGKSRQPPGDPVHGSTAPGGVCTDGQGRWEASGSTHRSDCRSHFGGQTGMVSSLSPPPGICRGNVLKFFKEMMLL